MDYLGPTVVRLAGEAVKAWVLIITCLTTRAVYLEATVDLTASSFLNVFRRFVARRTCPRRILSDNGTQFVLAEKAIRSITSQDSREESPNNYFARHNITWRFLPSLSPGRGGYTKD
jgi:hypothetical protein